MRDGAPPVPSRRCRFGPIEVEFDERVLVPRAWTLLQSEWAAELAAQAGPGPLLELCAGAGHIGLAAAVLSDRDLVQVELSEVAVTYARANAARAGWAARTEIRNSRLETALGQEERFPVVVADPPYLPTAEIDRFPEDPRLAIDGGPDGLDVLRACLGVAADHLVPGGPLLVQVAGPAQGEQVGTMAADEPSWQLTPEEIRSVDPERAVVLLRKALATQR